MQEPSQTALVTGATGFIGGHLVRRLVEDGWRVKLLLRNPGKLSKGLQNAFEIIQGDLADIAALKQAVTGVSVIFHCAAKVDSWGRREDYWATNVTGTQNLLEAIAENNPNLARLVHVSTVDVYGFPENPCDENAALTETGFGYGDSKIQGEIVLRDFCGKNNIPYTIIRPCNVIGPNSQFIERIGKELQSGLMLKINNGRANAGIVDVNSLVDHLLWAAKADQAIGQTYNIRDSYDISWSEFLSRFRTLLNGRGKVVSLPFGIADMLSRLIVVFYRLFMPSKEPLLHPLIIRIFGRTCGHNAAKIRAANPNHKAISFEEAMQKSIAWYKSEKS